MLTAPWQGSFGGLIILGVPFFIWGARIRSATWNWAPVRKFVHWDQDREIGEWNWSLNVGNCSK